MENTKKVWIINQYSSTPDTSAAGRHFYLSEELGKSGVSVDVVVASNTHLIAQPHRVKGFFKKEAFEGFRYHWLRTFRYNKANSKLRIVNWILFSIYILFLPFIIRNKPSSIIYSSPSLFGALPAFLISKIVRAKFVFEVRDIWPETLVLLGGYNRESLPIKFMFFIERFMYKHADLVISNLPYSVNHMVKSGMNKDKFHWIPNGIAESEVSEPEPLKVDVRNRFPEDKFVIGYIGTLGRANSIEVLLSAANKLKKSIEIHFVIVGKGAVKEDLEKQVNDFGLDNVTFLPPVSKKQVQSVISLFDVCYIGWRNEELYEYGISPNKLPEYLYSGKPILHSFSGNGDFVTMSNAGITVAAEDADAVAKGIDQLYQMSDSERSTLGQNGKRFVEDKLTYKKIARKLVDVLELNG